MLAHPQRTSDPPAGRVAAFCGLGNPDTFWQTLTSLGIDPVFTWTFRDHHVYKPAELRRLAAEAASRGADAIVTTEKDAMNLPSNFESLIAPLAVYWIEIETRMEEFDKFLSCLEAKSNLTTASTGRRTP